MNKFFSSNDPECGISSYKLEDKSGNPYTESDIKFDHQINVLISTTKVMVKSVFIKASS
jgi:hypothetical protein